MSGMLTVVGNPRRRRRNKRRRTHRAKARAPRRRRRRAVANPRPRRRRRVHNRRRSTHRRRRHHNPMISGFGMGDFMKGLTGAGVGAVGATLLGNFVSNSVFSDPAKPATPIVKTGVKAIAGLVGAFVVGKFLKQRSLAVGLAAGTGVVVALDLYNQFLHDPLVKAVPQLGDYSYGSLNDWAPQPGMSDYAYGALNGGNLYDGIYG